MREILMRIINYKITEIIKGKERGRSSMHPIFLIHLLKNTFEKES